MSSRQQVGFAATAPRWAGVAILAWFLVILPTSPCFATVGEEGEPAPEGEVLTYRWRIQGVHGFLARLLRFVPTSGDATLSALPADSGHLICEFKATSEKAATGDHWTFRAELDVGEARTLRIRESKAFRGKSKEKNHELVDVDAIDIVSGIHMLRQSPPDRPRRQTAWSDGKLYPVLVTPRGYDKRKIGGQPMVLRRFTISGLREPGQRHWKSSGDIWLTDDDRAIPAEILYSRGLGQLRLTLVDPPAVPELPHNGSHEVGSR
jgi:hypothetical protein